MTNFDCIIVGAGHGGAQAAIALRQEGYAGSITIVSAENELPYDRPSLSKDYLLGKKTAEAMRLRAPEFWTKQGIDLLLGRKVVSLNASARTVTTDDGQVLSYLTLIWSAGGSPRRLGCSGQDLAGVHCVRSKADVDGLNAQLATAKKAVIVGGGFIGLEAAAALRQRGLDVVLVEAAGRLLARVAGEAISSFYLNQHRQNGVAFLFDRTVAEFTGRDGRVSHVLLDDGRTIEADIVIVGIGIQPETDALRNVGCGIDGGVVVDDLCRTSVPDIYCVGDCAAMTGVYPVRLESIQNANDQAKTAARSICGKPVPHKAVPWFWSNQYDLRLQTVGLSIGHDTAVIRGRPEDGSFTVIYLRSGVVIALDCVNAARDYVQGRRLVEGCLAASHAELADTNRPLKEISAPAAMEPASL